MYKELVDNLREHADWAAANEWETPITLGDDLAQAADAIDKLQSELEREKRELEERNRGCEYCYTDAKSNPFVGGYNYCPMCGRRLKGFEWLKVNTNASSQDEYQEVIDRIKQAPACDVVAVRHGRWKRYGKNLGECSECGEIVSVRNNYCPACGCLML